jgi:hypothetical protein
VTYLLTLPRTLQIHPQKHFFGIFYLLLSQVS